MARIRLNVLKMDAEGLLRMSLLLPQPSLAKLMCYSPHRLGQVASLTGVQDRHPFERDLRGQLALWSSTFWYQGPFCASQFFHRLVGVVV